MTDNGPVRPIACPECAAILVGVGGGLWCPNCEWNLDALPVAGRGSKARADRRLAASAFALDRRLFAELAGGTVPGRPRLSRRLLTVACASVLLGVVGVALLAVGVTMVVTASWPVKILGLFLIGCVLELRPRLPGIGVNPWCKSRSEQPALFEVIDAVAAQIGSPSVDVVVMDEVFDASCARYGVRRRRVLVLGLPLWASLGPEGRIALLAHQLAHLVDGDPDQNLLTQPALTTFGNLADSFAKRSRVLPDREVLGGKDGEITASQYVAMFGGVRPARNSLASVTDGLSALLFKPLHRVCAWAQRKLRGSTADSRHRAEYYADALALDVAGSAGMLEYCHTLLLREEIFTTTRRWLRVGADIGMIHLEAADLVQRNDVDLRQHEQRSIRTDSSLFAAHPPIGWRLRMLRSWPTAVGRLSPQSLDLDSVDAQLGPEYRRVGRALTHVT